MSVLFRCEMRAFALLLLSIAPPLLSVFADCWDDELRGAPDCRRAVQRVPGVCRFPLLERWTLCALFEHAELISAPAAAAKFQKRVVDEREREAFDNNVQNAIGACSNEGHIVAIQVTDS